MLIGTVAALWRHPVKSMLGEQVDALRIDARGADGDRRYAVRDVDGKLGSGKTTRQFRRIDGLSRFAATLHGEIPVIQFPDGTTIRGDDLAVHSALTAALGLPVTLAREDEISHFDASPLHLVATSSLRAIDADARRFRPNIVVETEDGPFPEGGWSGFDVAIGDEVRLRITSATERCAMTGLAWAELPANPQVLKDVVRMNDARLGIYADVLRAGMIRVGDRIERIASEIAPAAAF